MGIREFFEKHSANFLGVLNKVIPSLEHFSPYLLFATVVIASSGDLSGLNISLASFIGKIVEKILIDFPINQILDKITGSESSELSKEEKEELKKAIENLSEQLEEASKQNIGFDRQIGQFIKDLIDSDYFKNMTQNIEGLNLKINAMRNELYERLENIEEEIRILNKVNLPKIESVLEKGTEKPPEFFRRAGPIWVDFQEGYIYEHPVVNEIIEGLKKKDIVVIKGTPASGKSVILRNVGYKLANEGADVYFIGLKTSPSEKVLEISKIHHGYIIVDDAHLNVNFVEDLLLNRPNAKVIIASRDIDIERVYGPTSEYKFSEYLKSAINIEANNSAEKIIEIFEKKIGKIPIGIKKNLAKNNLWILAWQLETYKRYKSIDNESVLKTVKAYIESLSVNVGKPENVLAPLAIFYRYEIPVRKAFIEYFTEEDVIKKLEALNEISTFLSDRKDYVALHHSEVARIYMEAFDYFKDFGREVKNKINKNTEKCLMSKILIILT